MSSQGRYDDRLLPARNFASCFVSRARPGASGSCCHQKQPKNKNNACNHSVTKRTQCINHITRRPWSYLYYVLYRYLPRWTAPSARILDQTRCYVSSPLPEPQPCQSCATSCHPESRLSVPSTKYASTCDEASN